MTKIINKLTSLFNDIDSNVQKAQWEEKIYRLIITSNGSVENFTDLFKNPTYNQLLEGSQISFEFYYNDDIPIRNYQFIEYIEQKLIPENADIKLIISLNKQYLFNLSKNTLLFFRIPTFKEAFQFENPDFIDFFKEYDSNKMIDLFLPVDAFTTNEFLNIYPLQDFKQQDPNDLSDKWSELVTRIKEERDDLCRVEEFYPIPNLFKLQDNTLKDINNILNKNLFYLSLLHLANKTKENTFIIRGQKNLEISWNQNFEPIHADTLFQIFKFSFGKEQTVDKLEITRNIFTIYLHEDPLNQLDLQLVKMQKTIERQFSLYVQDKIKKFFDDTKDAIELARKYALEAKDAADKIIVNINTAIITLITAIFSGIVIMARGNYKFFIIALALHILYLVLSFCYNRYFACIKKKDILRIYDLTNDNFMNISDDEKQEIKKEYVTPAVNTITQNLKHYLILCIALIGVMISLIFGTLYFADNLQEKNSDGAKEIKEHVTKTKQVIDEKVENTNNTKEIRVEKDISNSLKNNKE